METNNNDGWFIIEIEDDPDEYEEYDIEESEEHKFQAGKVRVVISAQVLFEQDPEGWREYVERHLRGDYGVMSPDDWKRNDHDIVNGGRALSMYELENGAFYVETWPGQRTVVKADWDY